MKLSGDLHALAVAVLREYLRYLRPRLAKRDTDAVFLNSRGRPMTRFDVRAVLKKYGARAGLNLDVSPHALRHSMATHMLEGGADVRTVQELLGHRSLNATQIYTAVDRVALTDLRRRFHPRGREDLEGTQERKGG